jgi:protoporphyrin/coproporphyrin ferrochelatase
MNKPPLGILITNLGTPDAPTPAALRRYLGEFLWDPRVVDLPRPLWWLILHGVILRIRPRRSARAYQSVWSERGSPLLVIAREQEAALQQRLDSIAPGRYRVALGMRYGNPSIPRALDRLQQAECESIFVLPLYPQNSCSTIASTLDAVAAAMRRQRAVPHLRFVADYHLHPAYINALANSIREAWQQRGQPDKLIFSFHGTPARFRHQGDPYYDQCQRTAIAVTEALGLQEPQWLVAFQSRFGREEWLRPYTDHVLAELPQSGVKRVDIICPGFSADCLETLEEIAVENRDHFLSHGGKEFHYIPALNSRADHIDLLAQLVTCQGCQFADR